MRMLEIFSSERTYLPVLLDANCVASLIEQILHYMVQTGKIDQSPLTMELIYHFLCCTYIYI